PNVRRKPFDDVRVRQAMSYAIDCGFIARAAFPGELGPANGPISAAFKPWHTDDVMAFGHDPAKAKALLDKAGLKPAKGGVRFRASLIFDPSFQRAAQLLKQQLGGVGIKLDLKLMDFNAWIKKLYIDKDFDLGYSRLTGPADPDIGVKRAFISSNIAPVPFSNGESYRNPKVDALFERAARETDMVKRVALYAKIQQIIVIDQPQFFLVGGVGPWAWSPKFRGIDEAGSKSPYAFGRTAYMTSGSDSPPPSG
ncbi:MAG: ABC transporter substrate-binding protein, partial [Solirubrobacteraceae bacterium]